MLFEFATAGRVVFGNGAFCKLLPDLRQMGRRVLLVAGGHPAAAEELRHGLCAAGADCVCWTLEGEPSVDTALAGVRVARENNCDLVIGLGGGSALDAGKAVAALLTNPGDPLQYLEVVGHGLPLRHPSAPYVAIPTTAGTGSEVTRNAVLCSPEHRVKVSLRSPLMLPRLAVVDPELTYSLPPEITASTGLDALTQVIEPFVGNGSQPMTDALCREGIRRAARSLRRAVQDGSDADAREDMSLASLFGGMALANARLGAVHGLAGPLGGMFPAPHGVICARLLPHVVRINIRALRQRAAGSPILVRYAEVAVLVTGRPGAACEDGIVWLEELCRDLAVPPLKNYGLAAGDFPDVVPRAQQSSSMKGNPLPLTDLEILEILHLESQSP